MCTNNCNNHGNCIDGICVCDAGWFRDCDYNLKNEWQEAYYFYMGFFILLFATIGIYSIQSIGQKISERRFSSYLTGCSFICSVISAPQNICITLSVFACIIKIVWLAVDPFQINNILERQYERMLAEIIYSFLFAIYAVVLIIWYSIYDEISFNTQHAEIKTEKNVLQKGRQFVCGFFKYFLKLRIIFVFILQLGVSYAKGMRMNTEYRYYSYIALGVLYVNFVVFIIEFFIYGRAVYKCIRQQRAYHKNQWNLKKTQFKEMKGDAVLSVSPIFQSNDLQNKISNPIVNQIDLNFNPNENGFQEFEKEDNLQKNGKNQFDLPQSSKQKSDSVQSVILEEADVNTWKPVQDDNHAVVTELKKRQLGMVRVMKEKIEIEAFHEKTFKRQNNINFDKNNKNNIEEITNLESYYKQKRETLDLDKKILNQILLIIVCGVFLEICFAILSVITTVSNLLQTPEGTLTILYVAGVLEALSLIVILRLFATIRCKEIENLRWISKVGDKKSKINTEYKFKLPEDVKERDKSKAAFEKRLNQQ